MANAMPAAEIAERRGQLARQAQRLDIKLQGARVLANDLLEKSGFFCARCVYFKVSGLLLGGLLKTRKRRNLKRHI